MGKIERGPICRSVNVVVCGSSGWARCSSSASLAWLRSDWSKPIRAPTQAEIDFAIETTDLLQAELFAALLQEFDETTPANVEQGKVAISLIFSDKNDAFRLVGDIDPLRDNDTPRDAFERQSLALALNGQGNEVVQKVKGKYYVRRSVPLSNFSPACVLCHSAFGPTDPSQWVGALMMKVPTDP